MSEAARIVDVPPSTMASWAKGYVRRLAHRADVSGGPVITFRPSSGQGEPSIPFVGLAEALVLSAVRRSGVPMQRIRPALVQLQKDIGVEHALASRKLSTDGAELLYDYGQRREGTAEGSAATDLVVLRNGQRVFVETVEKYLRHIRYAADGYVELIRVPAYEQANVVADPKRSFGAPIFERGAARVEDVLQRFWAGESISQLNREFGVPVDQLEDVLRVASRRAA